MANFVELPVIELNHRGAETGGTRWFNAELVAWIREDFNGPPMPTERSKKKGAPDDPGTPSRCLMCVAGQTFTIDWPLLDLLAVMACGQD